MRRIPTETMFRHVFFLGVKWQSALCIGLIATALFVTLSSVRLTAQGLYYDELHQATASFAYGGTTAVRFCSLSIRGIPVLNMKYSGAIKSAVYGLYLRYFGSHFSVKSWRLLGIFFVSTGVFLFCVVARRGLSPVGLLSFLLLFLTDITVILATRHDWGPVALALLFRLLFIATWTHGETGEYTSISNTFFLGSLVGIAIFEKLTSVALILPLILILVVSVSRRSLRHRLACIAGSIAGGIPLIFVNLYTFFRNGSLISLDDVAVHHQISFFAFMQYISTYISLGNGALLKGFILGTAPVTNDVEGLLVGAALLLIAVIVVRYWKQSKLLRMSGIMLLCYGTVGIVVYWFSWVHHWIIGTPFQYAAISLAVMGLHRADTVGSLRERFLRITFMSVVVLLLISRLPGIVSVEKSFLHGEASLTWDPSLTEIGYSAGKRANEAVFIAADWGVATQIYCLSDGQPDLVHELFWNYQGPQDIRHVVEKAGKKTLYVVVKKPNSKVKPENTARILRDMEKLPGWDEIPVESEVAELGAVEVRKFSYVAEDSK